ncbi:MAG TPA: DUF6516 family protein [Aurantimonas sp.]|jgi:hypothetical protein|nr:DUF6516 family protein [Aurantimonas sp.]
MHALLLIDRKFVWPDGSITQVRVWQLPQPTTERPHGLKYSLFYGRSGQRFVGYDNETGKGDHRHYGDREEPYGFSSLEQLIDDFEADVRRERKR